MVASATVGVERPYDNDRRSCNVLGMKKELALFAVAAALLAARQYYRNWGATKEENRVSMLGDGVIHRPATERTAAEWIDAPVEVVWPRVLDVVFGKDRSTVTAAPAIGDGVRLPVTIGGRAMGRISMSVVDVVEGRALVLRTVQPRVPVDVTWAWLAEARWEDRTRLIVRLRIALRHPGDFVIAEAVAPIVALVTRRALVAIRSAAVGADGERLVQSVGYPTSK